MSTLNPESKIPYPQKPKANRQVKDSIFRALFADPKNILDMYRVLHPEDHTATESDISIITLESILTSNNDINDLGFMVNNHLLILVEAQTKWSPNILIRSLIYLAHSLKNYIASTKQNYYEAAKVNIPIPELYVVYTGPERELPEHLSLQQEFFDNIKTSIEVNLKIIYNKGYKDTNNIFLQYLKFVSLCYKMRDSSIAPSIYDKEAYDAYALQTISRIVDYCIANNILKDYLKNHRLEVIDMMTMLYDPEEVRQMENNAAEARGERRGRFLGKQEGALSERLKSIRALISKNFQPDEAMNLLDIPPAERPALLAQLAK